MTTQIAERLRYQGNDMAMCTQPLSDYFAMGGFHPQFQIKCTALWRGYLGSWEIVGGRLYLVELEGTLVDGTEASLTTIFPDFPDRVFAHWYSGTIRTPRGKPLKYIHAGYGSTFEQDLLLEVERGVVVPSSVHHNGAVEAGSGAGSYEVGATTVFPRSGQSDGDSA